MKKLAIYLSISVLVAGCFCVVNPASAETNMVHRWSFNEASGTTVTDSIGSANGTLRQLVSNSVPQGTLPSLDGTEVTLDGDGGYVDLPNGIFSGLSNATIEIWFRYLDDTDVWVNLLCAGAINNNANTSENALEDTGAGPDSLRNTFTGGDYWGADGLFITPRTGGGEVARFAISDDTNATFNFERPQLDSAASLFNDTDLGGFPNYIAVTYGPEGQRLFVFSDEQAYTIINTNDYVDLSAINDINVWLGRSMYGADPMLNATVNELRIHDTIVTGPEIAASYFAGALDPDVVSYDSGSLSFLDGSTTINPAMSQAQTQPVRVLASYSLLGDIPISDADLDYSFSTDTNILEVIDGVIVAKTDGLATVHFGLDGISNSVPIIVNTVAPVLAHRWSFSETSGTTLVDSESGADASIVELSAGGQTSGAGGHALGGGQLRLFGGGKDTSDYIDLPDNILQTSQLTNVTFEAWLTPQSAQNWMRALSFGSAAGNTWFLSLCRGGNINQQRHGNPGRFADQDTDVATTLGQQYHYVAVYGGGRAAWYRDGVLMAEVTGVTQGPLTLTDTNNWVGRSQWPDNTSDMDVNEVRLWNGTLLPLSIALNNASGPDTIPPDPGALLSIAVDANDIMLGDPVPTPACLCATFENISGVNLVTLGGTLSSSDTAVINVDANGIMTGVGAAGESATISGSYFSEPVTPLVVNIFAPTGLVMNLTGPLVAGDFSVSASLEADFPSPALQDQDVTGFNDIVWSSSDPAAAAISDAGLVTPTGPGVAEIVATYGGLSATSVVSVTIAPGHTPSTLLHRYSFSEAADSTTAVDSVGGADGEVLGVVPGSATDNFNGAGQLVVSGVGSSTAPGSAYVNLPNGLISSLTAVTMEGWLTDSGAQNWERWFDFGMSSGDVDTNTVPTTYGEDAVANPGRAYFFLARAGTGTDLRFAYKQEEDGETGATFSGGIVDGSYNHFAVVVDPPNGIASLYLNGERVSQTTTILPLSVIDDRNNWLGRSQYGDTMFGGSYDEFRIWDGTLLGADVQAAYAAGPNTVINPIVGGGPELAITLALPNVIISWPVSATGFTLEAATEVDGPYSPDGLPAPTVVGDQNQVTLSVDQAANLFFRLSN